eukprot:IDg7597t1
MLEVPVSFAWILLRLKSKGVTEQLNHTTVLYSINDDDPSHSYTVSLLRKNQEDKTAGHCRNYFTFSKAGRCACHAQRQGKLNWNRTVCYVKHGPASRSKSVPILAKSDTAVETRAALCYAVYKSVRSVIAVDPYALWRDDHCFINVANNSKKRM